MDIIIKKITSWNKLLWAITIILWSIVCVQWVSSNVNPETGERIQLEGEKGNEG